MHASEHSTRVRELILETGVVFALVLSLGLTFVGLWGGLITLGMAGDLIPELFAVAVLCPATLIVWLVFLSRSWPSYRASRASRTLGCTSFVLGVAALAAGIAADIALSQLYSITWVVFWSAALATTSAVFMLPCGPVQLREV
jgi:hypothetical protein